MMAEKPLPFLYQFSAGAVAGLSEVISLYPLDVAKTRLQLQKGSGEDAYKGTFDVLSRTVRQDGVARLYRGISTLLLLEPPKRATKFAANDSFGTFYRNFFGVEKTTQPLAVLGGASAGAVEACLVSPMELLKIRLQDKAQAGKYNGLWDCFTKVVRTEGPLAMANGLESTIWRHVLWNSGYFGCIFQVRAQLPKAETKSQQIRNDLIGGSCGGFVGTLLNTPMDVAKSRIQNTPKIKGEIPLYNWAWPAVIKIARDEGLAGIYRGFLPKVLRLGPGGGILLVVYTGVMDFFRKMRGES